MRAEAAILQRVPRHLNTDIESMAACTVLSCRLFIASVMSHLTMKLQPVDSAPMEPVLAIRYCSFDETPLKLRALNTESTKGKQTRDTMEETQVWKLYQVHVEFGCLMLDKQRGRHQLLRIPLLCPLQCADHGTAEVCVTWKNICISSGCLVVSFHTWPQLWTHDTCNVHDYTLFFFAKSSSS